MNTGDRTPNSALAAELLESTFGDGGRDGGYCVLCDVHGSHAEDCIIFRASQALASASETGGWIAVTERLPQERTRVLGANPLMVEVMYIDFGGAWCADNSVELKIEHHKPTHWMPLPEAPHV